MLASYSRGTPRIANRLSKRFRDIAQLQNTETISEQLLREGLELLHLSPDGLDMTDRQFLDLLELDHPKGLTTLAAQLHEDEETLENVIEPFLLQQGYIENTPRGRVLTVK